MFQGLTLALVRRDRKTQPHRKLSPLHGNGQRAILWMKKDSWDHDVISLVGSYSNFSIDDMAVQGFDDVSSTIHMASCRIKVPKKHDGGSFFQLDVMSRNSIYVYCVEILNRKAVTMGLGLFK